VEEEKEKEKEERQEEMASVRGAGDAGEGEWLKVAELKAMAGAQDPQAKVRSSNSTVH
jgi:hypothetical protein